MELPQFNIRDLCIGLLVAALLSWLFTLSFDFFILTMVSVVPALLLNTLQIRILKWSNSLLTSTIRTVSYAIFSFLLYVLSVGPVHFLTLVAKLDPDSWQFRSLERFYNPLEMLYHPNNPLYLLMEKYFEFWEGLA